jgi:superfamily I DNA/RNA helicase
MAILRAAYLANALTDTGRRVLLVTFNRTLVTYLRSLAFGCLPPIVDVHNYHLFARGYLRSAWKRPVNIADKPRRETIIALAVSQAKQSNGSHPVYDLSIEALSAEFEWIAKAGVRSPDEYYRVERVGRLGTRFPRRVRPVLYALYESYLSLRASQAYDCDWDDLALAVCDELQRDTSSRRYQHVIIDEGQDFSPMMLRSLGLAVGGSGSLTFFGDRNQQIYGTRISWRSAGLANPQVWRFEENYRNSRQIADLGLAMSHMPYFHDEEDLVQPREPTADGPKPTLVSCSTRQREFELALQQAALLGRTQSVAVLVRSTQDKQAFLTALQQKSIAVQHLDRKLLIWSGAQGVSVGTYHAAKGLEFDAVILPYCSAEVLPDPTHVAALGSREDALAEEGRMLYVAVTRARTRLLITHSGLITELLPDDESLYQKVNYG